jgi:hypothetical protein
MHCWNLLPGASQGDLTADQFDYEYELGEPVERDPIVDHTGVNRHELLAARVRTVLDAR